MIPCASCGAAPSGSFNDGSPKYACSHAPIWPGDLVHPAHRMATGRFKPMHGTLDPADQKLLLPVAKKVAARYEADKDAHMKYRARGRSIIDVVTDGLGAELFVARWTGLEWNRGIRRLPDVGTDVEVRNVRRGDGMLSLYEYDKGSRRYVLVVGKFPTYRLIGWLPGKEGMIERYWHPKGALVMGYTLDVSRHLIPQSDLRPMFEMEIPDAVPEALEAPEAGEAEPEAPG